MVKVSIIVPIYNVERYLERSINSLINQTLKEIEIILVNDGSSDNSLEICEKYKKYDNRIKVINKKNEGVSVARNVGIKNARGEYIVFMDPDDNISNTMYEELYLKIKNNACDICLCNYIIVHGKSEMTCELPLAEGIYKSDEIKEVIFNMIGGEKLESDVIMGSVWRGIYTKELIEKNNIYFPIDIRPMQDLIFITNYLSKCKTMYIDITPYYYYYVNPNTAMTGYKSNMWDNNKRVCTMLEELVKKNKFEKDIGERLTNRCVNSALASISNEANKSNNNKLIDRIKTIKIILNDNLLRDNIRKLNLEGERWNKKLVILLAKFRFSIILYIYYCFVFKIKK